jgi:fido (protein-threonine AMPylation protein)
MANYKEGYLDFEAYERAKEPHTRQKASAWRTAIGLQDVDGLKVSDYLRETAAKHIEGDITIDEARDMIRDYYVSKTAHDQQDEDTEEADKVSANITKLLNEQSFSFTAGEFLNIHRHIFDGVFKHAGEIRPYDISKKEWVLRGDTILYGRAEDIRMALEYDIDQERQFIYKGLSTDDMIEHICHFVSLLWQNHPFREGNTRTTAVFVIKYLRSCGFHVDNDLFAENSWYFRNALVRANYRNMAKGIDPDSSFLNKFFRNLLLGEHNELKNRYMLINPPEEWKRDNNKVESSDRPSTDQVPTKLTDHVSESERTLINAIGMNLLSIKEMMGKIGLKQRRNFMVNYIEPSIKDGLVTLLYPESPRHPRQKYKLTVKGLAVLNEIKYGNNR